MARTKYPARAELRAWLAADPKRRTRAKLAKAIGVSRQYLGTILREGGPVPSKEVRWLIHFAAGVGTAGWETAADIKREITAIERAKAFGEQMGRGSEVSA